MKEVFDSLYGPLSKFALTELNLFQFRTTLFCIDVLTYVSVLANEALIS